MSNNNEISEIILSPDYWDCECPDEKGYIHPISEKECLHCGARQEDCPEARENEVANPKLHSKPFMPKDIQLFIRACKTLDSKKRVLSVYKRIYYLSDYMDSDVHIANILMDICHKYNLINLTNFAIELDPDYFLTRLYDEEYNYNKQIIRICINAIKFTKKDKLLECGLTIPKRFRK